jgi:hypothetical protein
LNPAASDGIPYARKARWPECAVIEKDYFMERQELSFRNDKLDKLLVRYLLGDLSPEQREKLEEEYFTSDEAWKALNAAENDLVDAYVRDRLSSQDRAQFERFFLGSALARERVKLAAALRKVHHQTDTMPILESTDRTIADDPPPLNPPLRHVFSSGIILAVTCAVLIAVSALLLLQNRRLRPVPTIAHSDQNNRQHKVNELQQSGASSSGISATSSSQTVSILLRPHLFRDGQSSSASHNLQITPQTIFATLLFSVERSEYSDYEISLKPADGSGIIRRDNLEAQIIPDGMKVIKVHLASDVLPSTDFLATLNGRRAKHPKWEVVDSYQFSVSR